MSVLVTGGAGYIGSHTCICMLEAGKDVVVAVKSSVVPRVVKTNWISSRYYPCS